MDFSLELIGRNPNENIVTDLEAPLILKHLIEEKLL